MKKFIPAKHLFLLINLWILFSFTAYAQTSDNNFSVAVNSDKICQGDCAELTAKVTGGVPPYTYKWNIGHTTKSIKVCPDTTTSYTITVTDSANNATTSTATVKVAASPTVTVIQDKPICESECTFLIAKGANTYKWLSKLVTPSVGEKVEICAEQSDTIKVIGTSLEGCADTASFFLRVFQYYNVVTFGSTICAGESIKLTAYTDIPADKYTWQPGNYHTPSITVSPQVTTSYTVEISIGPCSSSAVAPVKVTTCTGIDQEEHLNDMIIYPNPFSDYTTVSFTDELKNATLRVLNILGEEVRTVRFSAKQLIIEKEDLPPGIYVAQIFAGDEIKMSRKIVVR